MIVAFATGFLAGITAAGMIDWWRRGRLHARIDMLEDRCQAALEAAARERAEADRARETVVEAREDRAKAWQLLAAELGRPIP